MAGTISITGVPTSPGPDGSIPTRREIRDLQTNYPDHFNVYLLGLRLLQGVNEDELTSYYQIAGIHGMPFKAWDGVESSTDWKTDPDAFGGYCTHSSVLFAPWHRPYLALFEQSLYAAVNAVALKFPPDLRARYVQAAQEFRMPYYDWAITPPPGTDAFPSIISSPKIDVIDTDGVSKSIDNPLYQFNFHPLNPNPQPGDFDKTWSKFPNTVRYPDQSGMSDDSQVEFYLENENASLRNNMSILLLSYHNFNGFTHNQWNNDTKPGLYGSLEDVHNEIHDKTGGTNGHMAALEVSAFDPVFWLHHTNVDRYWAIWQALNPDSFISPEPAPYTTFGVEGGASETAESALTPFWDATGTNFWTSNQVKESNTFGYVYPETQQWKYSSREDYQKAIRKAVVDLYGANVFRNFIENVKSRSARSGTGKDLAASAVSEKKPQAFGLASEQQPLDGKASGELLPEASRDDLKDPIPASLAHLAPDNKYTEWIVNVRALKHGLGQSFRVLVFLGDIDDNPSRWDKEFNCVGRVSVLGRGVDTQCAKCQKDRDTSLVVSGTVPLTSALLQDIVGRELTNLEPENVVPHLRDNLKVRVMRFNGQETAVEDVPGLKVSVCSTEAEIGLDGVPVYSGEYVEHPLATEALPGGIGRDF